MTGLTVWALAICQNITRQEDNNAPCLLDALGYVPRIVDNMSLFIGLMMMMTL